MKMQGVEVIETKDYLKERIQGALSGEEKQRQFTLGALGDATKTKIETDTK